MRVERAEEFVVEVPFKQLLLSSSPAPLPPPPPPPSRTCGRGGGKGRLGRDRDPLWSPCAEVSAVGSAYKRDIGKNLVENV